MSISRHNKSLKHGCSLDARHFALVAACISTSLLYAVSNIHLSTSPATLKEHDLHRKMSQEFLNHLLSTAENRVHSEQDDAICMICLEKYNTFNTSTGIIEIEIKLPCGHKIGSSCIVTWLQTNNNCPACWATFFSAQPRPYLEHGIMNADIPSIPRNALDSTRDIELFTVAFMEHFCYALGETGPFHTVRFVANSMARSMARSRAPHSMDLRQRQIQRSVAAASLYMASHVTRRPKTPMEITRVSGVSADQILSIYRQIYPVRMQLIDARALEHVVSGHVEGMLAFLPLPDRGDGIIHDEEVQREIERLPVPPSHLLYKDLIFELRHYMELGGSRIDVISLDIAIWILGERHLGLRSPRLVVAIGFYMAMHLLGFGASFQRIGEVVDINERVIEMAYARVYPLRNQLIKPSMLTHIGLENLPRAIEALPALNWPPLEA